MGRRRWRAGARITQKTPDFEPYLACIHSKDRRKIDGNTKSHRKCLTMLIIAHGCPGPICSHTPKKARMELEWSRITSKLTPSSWVDDTSLPYAWWRISDLDSWSISKYPQDIKISKYSIQDLVSCTKRQEKWIKILKDIPAPTPPKNCTMFCHLGSIWLRCRVCLTLMGSSDSTATWMDNGVKPSNKNLKSAKHPTKLGMKPVFKASNGSLSCRILNNIDDYARKIECTFT